METFTRSTCGILLLVVVLKPGNFSTQVWTDEILKYLLWDVTRENKINNCSTRKSWKYEVSKLKRKRVCYKINRKLNFSISRDEFESTIAILKKITRKFFNDKMLYKTHPLYLCRPERERIQNWSFFFLKFE